MEYRKLVPLDIAGHGVESTYVCINNGGSRLHVAQELDLDIPCLVNDHKDTHPGTLVLPNDVDRFYINKPREVHWTNKGLSINPSRTWEDDNGVLGVHKQ